MDARVKVVWIDQTDSVMTHAALEVKKVITATFLLCGRRGFEQRMTAIRAALSNLCEKKCADFVVAKQLFFF